MEAFNLVPRDGAATQVFTELAANFKLSDEVRDALIQTKLGKLGRISVFLR